MEIRSRCMFVIIELIKSKIQTKNKRKLFGKIVTNFFLQISMRTIQIIQYKKQTKHFAFWKSKMMICSKIIIHWLICLIVVVAISSAQQHRCSNNYQVVQGGFGCNNRSSRRLFSDTPSHRIVTLRNGARVRGKLETSIGKREMYFYKS